MLHCLSDVNQASLQLTEVESVSMEGYLKEFELFFSQLHSRLYFISEPVQGSRSHAF